jgi:MIP family channel proteins
MVDLSQKLIAEGIGTFGLVFFASLALLQADIGNLSFTGVALVHFTILSIMLYFSARISGGHLNPAVTLSMVISNKQDPKEAGMYVLAQLIGAILAGLILTMFRSQAMAEAPSVLGVPRLAEGFNVFQGLFLEAILTFFVVFVVWLIAVDEKATYGVYAVAVAAVFTAGVLVGGPLTGAALNPAKAFGPAIAALAFENHLIYWIGPLLGGAAAGFLYNFLFLTEREKKPKKEKQPKKEKAKPKAKSAKVEDEKSKADELDDITNEEDEINDDEEVAEEKPKAKKKAKKTTKKTTSK